MRRSLTAIAAAAVLTGCGTTEPAATSSEKSAKSITLTDASGAKVKLDGPAEKVVGTEWNVVESLVTLGVDPVGVADVKGYKTWDTAAPLKNTPKDIGTRGEPSMDTIASLSPDLIVATTDLTAAAVKQLRKIAPVLEVRSAQGSDQIAQMEENLDLIAEATGTTAKADAAKKAFDAKVAEGRKALADAGLGGRKIAFADGWVASNQVSVRPYTSSSLIGAVNESIGLKNAWTLKGDADYGLAATDVEGLTDLGDVEFAYIGSTEKASDPFANDLAKNAVWTSLPFVKKGNVHRLPDGIWMFGGPQSMQAYIDAVVTALTK
ncbi:iron-siderophore ABC transporter substrate-binding protein [Streptomyces pseudovenezuelae]|uniref:ABC-type Fe3+-hydroxamate transport system substrate-binding protein n=1 Tax=Streptomyces pseudovenezuelae TaxID=67350 RepID=A0ABT6LVT2_9ACTN|nr:iron-siderophore ABC transporter substrate-binding protein [Streptomyces pseudovenezuelae]MDH6220362.1 ABC-type Fe3+-hydroxamate transport system substrate-binding protein [Streptomyces pseudovenezuelae]